MLSTICGVLDTYVFEPNMEFCFGTDLDLYLLRGLVFFFAFISGGSTFARFGDRLLYCGGIGTFFGFGCGSDCDIYASAMDPQSVASSSAIP